MSIKKRIVSGAVVNAAGICMSAAAQIVSVPVLTSAWGVDRYGLWLMLTTIPAYLALSDLGFASAATSDMTMQVARGRHDQARVTFQSVWLLVNAVALAALGLTSMIIVVLPLFQTSLSSLKDYSLVLEMLVLYSALALNARIALAGLRASQNYALGTMLVQLMTLLEAIATLLIAHFGGSFLACAISMLLVQAMTICLLFATLRRQVPWMKPGFSAASWSEVKRLWVPAAAAMAIPIALAINLQGMVIVTGLFISTAAAATLAAVRTISRVAIQTVGAVNRATMPELSAAGAREHHGAMGKIVALNLATVSLILLPGGILFAAFGDRIVELWTHGKIRPESSFVALVALAMVAHGLWYFTSNLMLASNTHTKVTRVLVGVSLLSIGLAVPAAYYFGLQGVGNVLVISEVACVFGVLRIALKSKLIRLSDFESAMTLRFWRS
jgi:O-antigen/teichoic acid export membrane protein